MDNVTVTKPRDTNIELLRILAMLMIVFSHSTFSVFNQLKEYPEATNTLLQYMISGGGKIGINLFMLISGYFMCQSNISFKKFVKILVWIYFYDVVIGGAFFLIGYADFNLRNVIDYIYPFRNNSINYFTTAFLFYYVSIPFWRTLIDNMSRRMHLAFIIFGYICYVFYNDIPIFSVPLDAVFWFGYLYVISAYIRRYVDIDRYHNISGMIALLFLFFIYISIFLLFFVVKLYPIGLFSSANSTLAMGFSVATFVWFKGLTIKYFRIVNLAAASTFGVLLIHSGSSSIRYVVWTKIIRGSEWFGSSLYLLYMITSVLALYIVCTMIDIIYKKLIEKRLVEFSYRVVKRIIDKYELLPSDNTNTL